MKNKFLASIIAGAMVVTMLGTVTFAADAVTGDKEVFKPDSYITGQSTHTLFAFAADSADATIEDAIATPNKIIAIEQDADGAEKTAISIDSSKIGDSTHIIVYYGGDSETSEKAVIPVTGELTNVEIELGSYPEVVSKLPSETGAFYTDLLAVTYTFSPAQLDEWRVLNAVFTEDSESYILEEGLNVAGLFSGEGEVDLTFGFTGVVGADGKTVTAVPVYQEYQAQ